MKHWIVFDDNTLDVLRYISGNTTPQPPAGLTAIETPPNPEDYEIALVNGTPTVVPRSQPEIDDNLSKRTQKLIEVAGRLSTALTNNNGQALLRIMVEVAYRAPELKALIAEIDNQP